MRAAVLREVGAPLSIEERPMPEAGPGQVVVEIEATGMCHSDLHMMDGSLPTFQLPHVMGHEIAGRVHALGPGATGVSVGEPVIVYGGWGCERCAECLDGQTQLCDTARWAGTGVDGGFQQYLVVPSARYLLSAGDLDLGLAAVLCDAGVTPYHAVKKTVPHLSAGTTAVLIGAGGLGQFGVQFLKLMTPARIVVVDTSEEKRRAALELGADAVVDGAAPDAAEQVRAIAGGGAGAVLDFVGVDATLALSLAVLDQRGLMVMVGLGGGSVPVGFFRLPQEALIVSSAWGTMSDLREVVALAREGKVGCRIQRFGLDEINEAYAALARGEVEGRAVVHPSR